MKKKLIIGHLSTLIMGGMIYLLFRSNSLLMFKWLKKIYLFEEIECIRRETLNLVEYFPNWFLFSLPDGLWIFSYISLIFLIWDANLNQKTVFWASVIPCIAIISEFGQLFNWVHGTFDILDLSFYFLGTITPFLIFGQDLLYLRKNE